MKRVLREAAAMPNRKRTQRLRGVCDRAVTAGFRVTSMSYGNRNPADRFEPVKGSLRVVRGLASGIQPDGFGVIVIERDTAELALQ